MPAEPHVGFVTNSGRGTLDTIWTCLVTIAFCTWTVQRLQVVPWSKSKTIIFRKKLLWMSITVIVPEYVTWLALDQWLRAKKFTSSERLKSAGWTLQHAFYVDMGGLVVTTDLDLKIPKRAATGFAMDAKRENGFTIRLDNLMILLEDQVLDVPNISARDIKERSKSDSFAEVVTLLQIVYFVVLTIGRLGSGLPISLLEFSTLAFVFCAVFVEFFWWYKPLDIRSSTVVHIPAEKQSRFANSFKKLRFHMPEQDLAELIAPKLFFERLLGENDMSTHAAHVLWIGGIFNAIHIGAWSYSFPTPIEQLLWRIASVGACGVVIFILATTLLPVNERCGMLALEAISGAFYCVCRIYIVVEALCSFRSVPASLYKSPKWLHEIYVR